MPAPTQIPIAQEEPADIDRLLFVDLRIKQPYRDSARQSPSGRSNASPFARPPVTY